MERFTEAQSRSLTCLPSRACELASRLQNIALYCHDPICDGTRIITKRPRPMCRVALQAFALT